MVKEKSATEGRVQGRGEKVKGLALLFFFHSSTKDSFSSIQFLLLPITNSISRPEFHRLNTYNPIQSSTKIKHGEGTDEHRRCRRRGEMPQKIDRHAMRQCL